MADNTTQNCAEIQIALIFSLCDDLMDEESII